MTNQLFSTLATPNGLPQELVDVIVGTLLGDAKMTFSDLGAAFICEQGSPNKAYLAHLFDLFKEYCDKIAPVEYSRLDVRYDKTNTSWYFNTVTLPIFLPFAKLFYLRTVGTRHVVKMIPLDISSMLTARALAYWIMDDGFHTKRGGVTLCTDSFTNDEVLLLKSAIEGNFNLSCTLHVKPKGKRIYISGRDLPKLVKLVGPYMIPSMLYKLGQ